MATFNKRGYRTPKEKEEKLDNTFIEDVNVDEKDSTTAGVFNSLDESASRTEAWIEKNQKLILSIVGLLALITVGYLLYQKFVMEPKETEAAEAMFVAQQNFQQAADGTKSDSLYNLALKGSEGQFGFVEIADEYSGTDAGNLANYYAGIAYLNTGKYNEAIASLEKFKSDDIVLSALSKGAIGDAYSQKNQPKEALEHYKKASETNKNDFTTPLYLLKAGKTALALGQKEDALKYFTEIKDNYDTAPEAQNIDALIGLAQ
ncbi:MAG TPA: tetratricopeptide repeat protein [Flavobacterium sp.]|jgi:tetratricopeptide (TPR) repeat protein|nr:tetratricopeptide repeat protein [Flavobacterium sp.]